MYIIAEFSGLALEMHRHTKRSSRAAGKELFAKLKLSRFESCWKQNFTAENWVPVHSTVFHYHLLLLDMTNILLKWP